MYQVFDEFLASPTWQYRPALDTKRFYEALDQVVWADVFDPEAMAIYIGWKIGASRYDRDFMEAIHRCTTDARAVRDYLKITNRL
jgi:hypothetical protein